MWLIKLHIAICILCWLTSMIMRVLFKESYKRYKTSGKAKLTKAILVYICPVLNVLVTGGLFILAFAPDDFVDWFNEEENRK